MVEAGRAVVETSSDVRRCTNAASAPGGGATGGPVARSGIYTSSACRGSDDRVHFAEHYQ